MTLPNTKILCLTCLLGLSFFSENLFSNNFQFESITTRKGLSQNNINCILQDSRGFMWFGTNDGLNRFDGYEFKSYRVNLEDGSGLNSNLINCLAEDLLHNIWIGTTDRGLNLFNITKEKVFKIIPDPTFPSILDNKTILDICAMGNGEIWVLTLNKIYILIPTDNGYKLKIANGKNFLEFDSNFLRRVIQVSPTLFLVATTKGLYRCKIMNDNYYDYEIGRYQFTDNRNITDFTKFDKGIVMSSLNGLFFMDDNENFYPLSSNGHLCTALDSDDNLWAGTETGIIKYSKQDIENKPYVLSKDFGIENFDNQHSNYSVANIYIDKSDIIWAGTLGNGIIKVTRKREKFKHFRTTVDSENLTKYRIMSIFEDSKANLWFGTNGGGVSFLEHTKSEYTSKFQDFDLHSPILQNQLAFHEITIDQNKLVVIGSSYPLNHRVYSINNVPINNVSLTNTLKTIDKPIYSFSSDDNYLWIGTYFRGLYRYSFDDSTLVNFLPDANNNLASSIVRSLLCDSKNRVWVGTDKGLHLLTKEEKSKSNPSFIHYKSKSEDKSSISHNYILPIVETSEGIIWFGTLGGGINKYIDSTNSFHRITSADGLPNNNIKGILEGNEGNLWLSSNRGISKLNKVSLKITNFDMSDGLQEYEFSEMAYCRRQNGDLLFGGINGFNVFKPSDIKEDSAQPNLIFTELHVLNYHIKPNEKFRGRQLLDCSLNEVRKIHLRYKENSMVVYFTALDFNAPHKIQYKYKLEGFDNEWIKTTHLSRFAKYTSLLPGKYTLKVLATNSDGIWMKSPIVLDLTIIRPWLISNLAILTYIIALILVLIFSRKYTLIKIKMKNALLMERFEKEKISELTQMKLRFFTNISHEFRTPLTILLNYQEKLIVRWPHLPQEKINHDLSIIQRNTLALLRLVNQLMDFRKFEQGKMTLDVQPQNIVQFTKPIIESFQIFAVKKNIAFKQIISTNNIILWFDADKMEKIVNNILSNAFKYSKSGGDVTFSIEENKTSVTIKISDNGIGIPKELQKHVFERFSQINKIQNSRQESTGIGLSYTKGLIEMHKGKIDFESSESLGTTFLLTFQKGNKHFAESNEATAVVQDNKSIDELKGELMSDTVQTETVLIKKDNTFKILIVEDDMDLRSLICESLGKFYGVISAENGLEGLEKCLSEQPDLVISDIIMPEMDGYELLNRIKNDIHISHTPVILLTAKISQEHQFKGFKEGADAYVAKPFNMDILVVRINSLIESRKKMWEKINGRSEIIVAEATYTAKDAAFLKKVMMVIDENMINPDFSVEQLGLLCNISQVPLKKKIKALTGKTTVQFIRSLRLQKAAQLLSTGNYQISEVTYEVGYSDLQYFRDHFKKEFSITPRMYKKGDLGTTFK